MDKFSLETDFVRLTHCIKTTYLNSFRSSTINLVHHFPTVFLLYSVLPVCLFYVSCLTL